MLPHPEDHFLPEGVPTIPFKNELLVLDDFVPPQDVGPSDWKDADMLRNDWTADTDEVIAARQLLALMSQQSAGSFPPITEHSDPNAIRVLTPLPRIPPVWAQVIQFYMSRKHTLTKDIQSRQEVCESFDWFRSYQSGVYHSRGVVKGYLLSAFASR